MVIYDNEKVLGPDARPGNKRPVQDTLGTVAILAQGKQLSG